MQEGKAAGVWWWYPAGGWHGQTHLPALGRIWPCWGSPVGVCQASGSVGTAHTTSPRKEFVSAHGAELEGRKKNQEEKKKVSSYLLLVFLPFTPLPPFGSPAALDRPVVFLLPSLSHCTPLWFVNARGSLLLAYEKTLVPDSFFFFFNFPQEKNVDLIIYVKCQMQERGCAYLDIPSEAK